MMTKSKIESGTSGGPVVDEVGRLIEVVSHSPEQPTAGAFGAFLGFAFQALPRWIGEVIESADDGSGAE